MVNAVLHATCGNCGSNDLKYKSKYEGLYCDNCGTIHFLSNEEPDLIEQISTLTAQVEAMQKDYDESCHTVETLSSLLAKICDIVKGQPPELTLYSWHDLPEKVESMQAENKQLSGYNDHLHAISEAYIKQEPIIEAMIDADIRLKQYRSGGFMNKDCDRGIVEIDLPIVEAKKLRQAIASLEPAQVDKGDDSILFPGIRRSDAKKLGEIL